MQLTKQNLVKLRNIVKLGLVGSLAGTAAFASSEARAYTGQEMAGQAKIGITQARTIALKAHPGKIVSEELEMEGGGSGLRYSFDITSGTATQEVGVDARTGKVLENAKEGPHPD